MTCRVPVRPGGLVRLVVCGVVLVGCGSAASDENQADPVGVTPTSQSAVTVGVASSSTTDPHTTSVAPVSTLVPTSVGGSSPPPMSSVAVSTTTSVPVSTTSTVVPVSSTTVVAVSSSVSGSRVVSLVIPDGTAARLVAGEDVGDVLPSRLTLRVGDTLELVNQDSVFHIYGPVSARAGETVRWLLPQVGEFTGLCTSNTERTVTLTVVA